MRMPPAVLCLVACAGLPATAWAQDAQSIIQRMQERKAERWEGVQDYTVIQSLMGTRAMLFFERIEVGGPDGSSQPAFRMVPVDEITERHAKQQGRPTFSSGDYAVMADAYRRLGSETSTALQQEMSKAGLPSGLLTMLGGSKSEIGVSLNPGEMFGQIADMYDFLAEGKRESETRDKTADAREDMRDMASFASRARLVDQRAGIGNGLAYFLRADNMNHVQEVDGQVFTIQRVSLLIDADEYVPLMMTAEGSMQSGRKSTPMVIERVDQDYRRVGSLYEPHRQIMRIAGVLDDKQQAEMRKAQQQMAEFEKQMAQMPEAQRAMIESQMGSQLAMMRRMAEGGGGIEVVTEVDEIRVNTGLPDPLEIGQVTMGFGPGG